MLTDEKKAYILKLQHLQCTELLTLKIIIMTAIEKIRIKITALTDYVKRRKSLVDVIINALENNDCLLFETVFSHVDKNNVIFAVQNLWDNASAAANENILQVHKKIKFVLDGIRHCQDYLRAEPSFRDRRSLRRQLSQLEHENVLLCDVIALHLFKHPRDAERVHTALMKKLDRLLITQDMLSNG